MPLPLEILEAGRPVEASIVITKGDSFQARLAFVDGAETPAPIDLTAVTTVDCKLYDLTGDTLLLTFTATVTDAANGIITMTASKTLTDGLVMPATVQDDVREAPLGQWYCAVEDAAGNRKTLMAGSANLYLPKD